MKIVKILAACVLLCGQSAFAGIKGSVSCGGKPMVAVAVSDGKNVVTTDAQGRYELPDNSTARFVFVTKPPLYRTVGRHYKPIASSNHDFVLEKSPNESSNGNFSFVHITDTETFMDKRWIDNLKDWVKTNPTAFVIHTGDICYERGLNFHGRNLRSEHLGTDMFYCVGNHDLVKGEYGEKLWEDNFGPAWYSFDAGNVHFMVLPMLHGDHAPSYNKGQLIEWMKNDLAKVSADKKVIMFNHDLWFQGKDLVIRAGNDSLDMSHHNLVSFHYGHWHSHYVRPVAGIMTYSASTPDKGGIDHGVSVFRVSRVDSQGSLSNFSRYTGIDSKLAFVTPANGDTLHSASGRIKVLINSYRTVSPTSQLRVAVEDARGVTGRWVNLTPASDWSWSGDVPVSEGGVRLVAEAVFEDGTRLTRRSDFTVGGSHRETLGWSANVGGNILMVAPVSDGKRIFTATIDDDNLTQCFVVALDAVTGAEVWRYKTDNSVKGSIACDSDRVVACDAAGNLYALSTADGRLLWRVQLQKSILSQVLQGVALADGVVYAGQGNGFSAVDVRDGSMIWKNSEWGGGEGTTSTIAVGEGVALASAHWNGLFAHDIKSGKLLWKKNDSEVRFRDGTPVFYDGNVYLATSNSLMLINPRSGDLLKSAKCDVSFNSAASPVVTDKVIYTATSNSGIAAFDRLTFEKLWGYNVSPALIYTVPYSQNFESSVEQTPLICGELLIFGASDGYLYGVNRADGATAFKRELGTAMFSSLLAVEGGVVVCDFAGNILKLNIKPNNE